MAGRAGGHRDLLQPGAGDPCRGLGVARECPNRGQVRAGQGDGARPLPPEAPQTASTRGGGLGRRTAPALVSPAHPTLNVETRGCFPLAVGLGTRAPGWRWDDPRCQRLLVPCSGGQRQAPVQWSGLCFTRASGRRVSAQELLPLHRMGGALFRLNECTGTGGRGGPAQLSGDALGGRAGAQCASIFVLMLVRDCIASIYLDDLSGK